jgi:hypothetical protein
MPSIQILVRVIQSFVTEVPGPFIQGKQIIFSDDLVLERYDDSTPGSGSRRSWPKPRRLLKRSTAK